MGISFMPAINMWPPAWLWAFGLDKYDASLWMASFMSLAR